MSNKRPFLIYLSVVLIFIWLARLPNCYHCSVVWEKEIGYRSTSISAKMFVLKCKHLILEKKNFFSVGQISLFRRLIFHGITIAVLTNI